MINLTVKFQLRKCLKTIREGGPQHKAFSNYPEEKMGKVEHLLLPLRVPKRLNLDKLYS